MERGFIRQNMRHIWKKITKLVFFLAALAGVGSFLLMCIDCRTELPDSLSLAADQRRVNTIIALEKFYNEDFDGAFSAGKRGDLNDKELQYCLGWLYFDGKGIKEDKVEGFRLWLKSAHQGYAKAQNDVAIVYERGELGEKNIDKAIQWYSRAAAQGMSAATLHIGYIYENGIGGAFNGHKAIEWYTKAYEQGNGHAAWHLATIYERGFIVEKNTELADTWYRKASNMGDSVSTCHIATKYYLRSTNTFERAKGEKLLAQCATNGSTLARHLIVDSNEFGRSTEKEPDVLKAHEWCRKFAIEGDQAFQVRLADMYLSGSIPGRTASDAAKWYALATHGRNIYPEAFYKLGVLYSTGNGVLKNDGVAFDLFRKAVEEDDGNDDAQLALGNAYRNGVGTRKNILAAIKCYEIAAEYDNEMAILHLAEIYENGESVKRDLVKALQYYTKLLNVTAEEHEMIAQDGIVRCRQAIENARKKIKIGVVLSLVLLLFAGVFLTRRQRCLV